LEFRVKGLHFRVKGLEFGVKGLQFRVKGLEFTVEDVEVRCSGLGARSESASSGGNLSDGFGCRATLILGGSLWFKGLGSRI
jgi:hypothetical protein